MYFFVQFKGVEVGNMPRCYVARPSEIVAHMHTTRAGYGYTSLRENYAYVKGVGIGHTDVIPVGWSVSHSRIDEV